MVARAKLTPPQVAERLGVSPAKIVAWIRAGELRAINLASRMTGRPRYAIDEADLAAFEAARVVVPPTPQQTRRRKTPAGQVREFY